LQEIDHRRAGDFRQRLVEGIGEEASGCQRVAAVQVGPGVHAVEGEAGDGGARRADPVGVFRAFNAVAEDIVLEVDAIVNGPARRRPVLGEEPLVVVIVAESPDIGVIQPLAFDLVALGIIAVGENAVGEEPIARPGDVAGQRAVAVEVIAEMVAAVLGQLVGHVVIVRAGDGVANLGSEPLSEADPSVLSVQRL